MRFRWQFGNAGNAVINMMKRKRELHLKTSQTTGSVQDADHRKAASRKWRKSRKNPLLRRRNKEVQNPLQSI